jgi:hypothetical protein
MTAVMQAVAPVTGNRTLRAALVRGGRMVDERLVPAGEHVTVGPTERSTFVVAGLTASVRLLEWTRAGYRLHLGPGMSGRIAVGDAVAEVSGRAPVALDGEARGKIVAGDALVLFHFVALPAPAPRPELPLAARQGTFEGLDWKTTCIAAFSFLFHFGAMGTAYADFADTTVDDDGARLTQTVGSLRSLPPLLPTVEEHPDATTSTEPAKRADTTPQPGSHSSGKSHAGGPAPAAPGGGGRASDARAHYIADQLAREFGAMTFAIGGTNNNAIGHVLEQGDTPMGLLDGAARDAAGTRAGGVAGINLGGGGTGPVRPGAVSRGLPGPVDTHRDGRADDTGVVHPPPKPPGNANVSPPESLGGDIPDAGRAVAALRGRLKNCYKHALDEDPNMRGSVRVTARIGPNGEVTSVQAANSGLSSTMVSCVSGVVRSAQFGQTANGGAVAIPMTFIPQ